MKLRQYKLFVNQLADGRARLTDAQRANPRISTDVDRRCKEIAREQAAHQRHLDARRALAQLQDSEMK